jgi:hypothetical protein
MSHGRQASAKFVGAAEVRDYWRMSNKRFAEGTPRTQSEQIAFVC